MDVADQFDDDFIRTAKLPSGADWNVFAAGVREAVRIFLCETSGPDDNRLNAEVRSLLKAAYRRRYDEAAHIRENLSHRACSALEGRGRSLAVALPPADALRDIDRRDSACDAIVRLGLAGGGTARDRWRSLTFLPKPRQRPLRRAAERNFVMWLQVAYLDATGTYPAVTARDGELPGRYLGPFAAFVQECLRRVGSKGSAVELINSLQKARQEIQKRRRQ